MHLQPIVDFLSTHPYAADLVRITGEKTYGAFVASILRRLRKDESVADTELKIEVSRLREMIEELIATVDRAKGSADWDYAVEAHETKEPSFRSFADRAVNIAVDARVESKRRLVGRLIARRLQIEDVDAGEVDVSNALAMLEQLSEKQLIALAAMQLLANLGKPIEQLPNLDAGEAWLRERHGRVMEQIVDSGGWSDQDLETLGHVGAIAMILHRSASSLGGEHADAIQQWWMQNGLSPYEMLREDAGSKEWRDDMRSKYPISTAIGGLSRGDLFKKDATQPYRLDELRLTRAGGLLGTEVIATLAAGELDVAP